MSTDKILTNLNTLLIAVLYSPRTCFFSLSRGFTPRYLALPFGITRGKNFTIIKGLVIKSGLLMLLAVSSLAYATPKIQTWETSQGTVVYYVYAPELPIIDLEVVFDAGSSRDGDMPGLAMLTNGLLEQGAAGLNADAISRGFESLGAIYGSDVGYDSALVHLRSLTDETVLDKALENVKKVMSKPMFSESALERQRSRTLMGIQAKQQSPGALARDTFMNALYRSHPYANPTIGKEASVKAIKRDDIIRFYKQHYVSQNAMLVIVGAVERQEAEKIAEELMAVLDPGKPAQPLEQVTALDTANRVFIEYPSMQTHILVGQPGIKRGDPDYFPLYVGNHILGGGGMVSRLFEEVREKRGLSYSAYSHFSPMRFEGPFIAGLQTRADQLDEALSVLMETIQHFIDEGPSEAEMLAAKKNITGGYPLRIDSNSKILAYVTMIGYYDLPLDYLETFNQKVEAVTVAQIKDAFKRRLIPDKLVTVLVGAVPEENKEGD